MREIVEKLSQIMPIVLVFFVFYFFVMRPQQKKARDHQEMLKLLKRGDTVITTGGMMGVVERLVDETYVSLQITEGVKVTVLRSAIADILRDTPAIKVDVPTVAKNAAPKAAPKARSAAKPKTSSSSSKKGK